MTFNTSSPAVIINEVDLTTTVQDAATTFGAFAGVFLWGPVNERVLIDNEGVTNGVTDLVTRFSVPSNFNGETFAVISSFLAYGAPAWVVRAANTTSTNTSLSALTAYANVGAVSNVLSLVVSNTAAYNVRSGTFDTAALWVARWPGSIGNSLRVSECLTPNNYTQTINLASYGTGGATLTANVGSNVATITIPSDNVTDANTAAQALASILQVTDQLQLGNSAIGIQYDKITAIVANASGNTTVGTGLVTVNLQAIISLHTNINMANTLVRYWEFYSLVNQPPGTSAYVQSFGNSAAIDELHVVVVDQLGQFSGVPGTVLEVYQGVSRATDSEAIDGGSNYYATVINGKSHYVWFAHDYSGAPSNTSLNVVSATAANVVQLPMTGGSDGPGESNVAISDLCNALNQFVSTEDVTIDLLMVGKAVGGIDGSLLPNWISDNVTDIRKDCVFFASPSYADVVNNWGNQLASIINFRNNLRSTSYGFLDSGYKQWFDRYNNVYRWVPLNGDMAGLCARTDMTNDTWWSPAGFNRGNIKNFVQLAYNPRKAERDVLYPAGVNPVVTFPGMGTVLFGDRTLLAKQSAFNRINVRRLFITLERNISKPTLFILFEFNDSFTRAQFKNLVNPYLAVVKGRRGITDYLVVCDESNNPPQVIDANEFVGDIYVKPARSINFIQLNFVAVATGVAFTEVVGTFGS